MTIQNKKPNQYGSLVVRKLYLHDNYLKDKNEMYPHNKQTNKLHMLNNSLTICYYSKTGFAYVSACILHFIQYLCY